MDLDALRSSPIGSLVPISGTDGRSGRSYEYWAYLADPLPRDVVLAGSTWTTVAAAEAALGRLDEAARQVPEPSLLRRPSLRREAQSTSALEGTFAPLQEVLESDVEDREGASAEIREILNYIVAAEAAFDWIDERPLTIGLLGQLQGLLVQGTPGELADAGRLRAIQVVIGARGAAIEDARFVPAPPGDRLRAGIDDWLTWVNDPPAGISPVVQAAIAHYQFETLHPFSDGNGRIGRLLIVLQLMRRGVLEQPILVVSPWFEARRTEYQDALLDLSRSADWDRWISFFATGVAAAADSTRHRVIALFEWRQETIAVARAAGLTGVAERLAGELIGAPVVKAADVAANHGVSQQAAMNALRRLVTLGVLEERRRRGRISFIAPRVLELLSR